MENTTVTVDSFKVAIDAGEAWALNLKAGDLFAGAAPAAEAAGYMRDSVEGRLFVSSALMVLDKGRVMTDREGRLLEAPIPNEYGFKVRKEALAAATSFARSIGDGTLIMSMRKFDMTMPEGSRNRVKWFVQIPEELRVRAAVFFGRQFSGKAAR